MKLFILLTLAVISSSQRSQKRLRCWQCKNQPSNEACYENGKETTCNSDQDICFVRIRKENGLEMIFKGCKQDNPCGDFMRQNDIRDYNGGPRCNPSKDMSLCSCCCKDDLCNYFYEECAQKRFGPLPIINIGLPADATACPDIPLNHGSKDCSNRNRVNSFCVFSCDEGFHIFPHESDEMRCLSNGEWDKDPPCCARINCQPHAVYDIFFMAHASSIGTYNEMYKVLASLITSLPANATHGVQHALFDFGARVHEETVLNFLETAAGDYRPEAPHEHNINDTEARAGVALAWAFRRMRSTRAGYRRSASTIIIIAADYLSSDDNVIRPSNRWRNNNALIYFVEFKNAEGNYEIDEERILDIVEEHGHVLQYEGKPIEISSSIAHELVDHLCINDC